MPTPLVAWVEIPVTDIERASKFYGAMFGKDLEISDDGPRKVVTFPHDQSVTGASLTQVENFRPSKDGVLVYFWAGEELSPMLNRALEAGGTLVMEKTSLGEGMGYFVTLQDTEGNIIALYATQ